MIMISKGYALDDAAIATMFEDRKRLFIDLLGWDVPVTDDRYEIDQFDGDHATYLIACHSDGGHNASLRLLPTNGPHILGDLFGELCDHGIPRGPKIAEITRLCLPTRLGAACRLAVRNRLISAMVDHALASDISALTGVVARDFLAQILEMGWDCAALGEPRFMSGGWLGAFRIEINRDTPALLGPKGIYTPGTIAAAPACVAA